MADYTPAMYNAVYNVYIDFGQKVNTCINPFDPVGPF